MKFLDNLSKRLNPQQKIILGIVVPLILLVITTTWAKAIRDDLGRLDKTWLLWVSFLALVGYFEYNFLETLKTNDFYRQTKRNSENSIT
jgi:hypothetical protein